MKVNFETFAEHSETQKKDFAEVKATLSKIEENHLFHIKESLNTVENNLIQVQSDQAWLMKFFWMIAGVTVTTLGASILALVLK